LALGQSGRLYTAAKPKRAKLLSAGRSNDCPTRPIIAPRYDTGPADLVDSAQLAEPYGRGAADPVELVDVKDVARFLLGLNRTLWDL
jgi:hypothetical protein